MQLCISEYFSLPMKQRSRAPAHFVLLPMEMEVGSRFATDVVVARVEGFRVASELRYAVSLEACYFTWPCRERSRQGSLEMRFARAAAPSELHCTRRSPGPIPSPKSPAPWYRRHVVPFLFLERLCLHASRICESMCFLLYQSLTGFVPRA